MEAAGIHAQGQTQQQYIPLDMPNVHGTPFKINLRIKG
jgi:hypothetical protein